MKLSMYLKSGAVITFNTKAAPELTVSEISGRLLHYEITEIVGKVKPLYINPTEVDAVVMETDDSEISLCG